MENNAHLSDRIVSADGLGPDDKYSRRAYVWFACSLIFAFALTFVLSSIDRAMYDSGAPYLDEAKYRENRRASTFIASETTDSRNNGTLSSAK